jgi:hypothetical protein
LIFIFIIWLAGCTAPPSPASPVTPTLPIARRNESPTPSIPTPTLTPIPTVTPTSIPTRFPTHFCQPESLTLPGHFVFSRPIAADGRLTIDQTYRYGATAGDTLNPHHGVEIINPGGTPVLAAGAGEVVFAGQDSETVYGPYLNFYGNLVILKHTKLGFHSPVYTLYGHLSEIVVVTGQSVQEGEVIGAVGLTGIASGTHLHFEVRTKKQDYASTRNPELWLRPLDQMGAIAGYLLDAQGELVYLPSVALENEHSAPRFLELYAGDGVNSDDVWGENFALNDLAPGFYTVKVVYGKVYQTSVEVQAGLLTLVPFCLLP